MCAFVEFEINFVNIYAEVSLDNPPLVSSARKTDKVLVSTFLGTTYPKTVRRKIFTKATLPSYDRIKYNNLQMEILFTYLLKDSAHSLSQMNNRRLNSSVK